MEAATLAPQDEKKEVTEGELPEGATAVAAGPVEVLYKWSAWVHIGPGATVCEAVDEQAGTNDCSNPLHFHAWCRLPNQFQHRAIRDKALAARARKTRLLRDPEADAYAILEEELDELARGGDVAKEAIVGELLDKTWWKDYLEAVKDLAEVETDEGEKKWGTVAADQTRHLELVELPEDQRPADEFAELERHLTAYNEALVARHAEIMKPRREGFETRDLNDLIDELRSERIGGQASEEFMHVYSAESWLVGAQRYKNGPPCFADSKALAAAAPEVIDALQATFDDLEQTKARIGVDAEGNS
jgi:hypothetical protein